MGEKKKKKKIPEGTEKPTSHKTMEDSTRVSQLSFVSYMCKVDKHCEEDIVNRMKKANN